MKKTIACIIGTRPEGIKLAPIIHLAKQDYSDFFTPIVIATGQHKDLVNDVYDYFKIVLDYTLNIDRKTQLLSELQALLTQSLESLFINTKPDLVMVQGDTLSTLAGAMAAYFQKIPVAYVESGLRSGQLYAPFPEEANRLMVTKLVAWHFTPTSKATSALNAEGIVNQVFEVGNTVVDSIDYALSHGFNHENAWHPWLDHKQDHRKMVLITIHRRENWDTELDHVIAAVESLSDQFKDCLDFVWISHANPLLAKKIHTKLDHVSNIFIYPQASYPQLLHLMKQSYLILTDSGGIQEEAPTMNKPVLVARDVSERMEGVDAGCAILVGTKTESIINHVTKLVEDGSVYDAMTGIDNPYGDGQASRRILDILRTF